MYKSLIIVICLMLPAIAVAGRHGIAREEAARIVDNRFAQFYRDEAARKQAEQIAMEQEIAKARDIEAAMLRDLSASGSDRIISADELAERMQQSPEFNFSESFNNANDPYHSRNFDSSSSSSKAAAAADSTFFDIKSGSKESNPFLFLQELQNSDHDQRSRGIKEVVASLMDLPDSPQLAEQFANDLAKISPLMAEQFLIEYKSQLQDLKETTQSKKSTDPKNNPHQNKLQSKQTALRVKPSKINQLEQIKQGKAFNTITTYDFSSDKLYQIYAAPHKVTAIVLAPYEKITGTPICGDLTRWKISTIKVKDNPHQHIMIQPLRAGISTSITLATNQGRLYVLEATSLKNNYMAVVKWNYAQS
jgi:hypothetical protein